MGDTAKTTVTSVIIVTSAKELLARAMPSVAVRVTTPVAAG
jgi:hypothetical protein